MRLRHFHLFAHKTIILILMKIRLVRLIPSNGGYQLNTQGIDKKIIDWANKFLINERGVLFCLRVMGGWIVSSIYVFMSFESFRVSSKTFYCDFILERTQSKRSKRENSDWRNHKWLQRFTFYPYTSALWMFGEN